MYITTLIIFFQSFIGPGLNGKKYSCIDRCQFKINNDSYCLNQVVDFICGHCTNKFCLDHLTEQEHTKEGEQALRQKKRFWSIRYEQDYVDSRPNKVNSTLNVVRSIGLAKSSPITCTSSCFSYKCSSTCSCTTCSCSFKSNLISGLLQDFFESEIEKNNCF